MEFYHDPGSTSSRAVLLFAAEHRLALQPRIVSLMAGEQHGPEFDRLNPNRAVPVLKDGDFVLTEASAILKYLADSSGSRTYPTALKARAQVNAAMDWFNTNFYAEFGLGFVYPQVLPHHRYVDAAVQAAVLERAFRKAQFRFGVLDRRIAEHGGDYVLGQDISLADYLGSICVSIGEYVDFDLRPFPHVSRWMDRMRARPCWDEVNAVFYSWRDAMRPPLQAALVATPV